jgi:hypothetical protein
MMFGPCHTANVSTAEMLAQSRALLASSRRLVEVSRLLAVKSRSRIAQSFEQLRSSRDPPAARSPPRDPVPSAEALSPSIVIAPPTERRARRSLRRRMSAPRHDHPLAIRLAKMMIARYGADAIVQAVRQGNALLAKGDVDGLMAWLKVVIAINRLGTRPSEGERVQ